MDQILALAGRGCPNWLDGDYAENIPEKGLIWGMIGQNYEEIGLATLQQSVPPQ
jgi:hypothetical protein